MKISVKIAGIAAAFALAITAAAPTAGAQTISELQALIAQLQMQISALSTGTTSVTSYTYTRDLTNGSTGADVTALQTFLEAKGFLTIPAGVSKGYFGPLTTAALAKYQASVAISPAVGYFGPITRAKVNQETAVVTDGGTTGSTGSTPTGLMGGDGDFDEYDVLGSPDSTDIEEGEMKEVLAFEFDAQDSDLLVERLDVLFAETASGTDKPWKVLETITLEIDGDEVAEIDASDSDEWDEEQNDEYSVRFDDIEYVVREGDTAKAVIWVTAKNSIDSDDLGDWALAIMDDGVRAVNAEGIQVYEGTNDDNLNSGSDADDRTFTLEEATIGDMDLNVDDDENDDRVVTVDDDNDTNDEVIYFATLESNDGDNTVEEVRVTVATTTGTTNGLSDFTKTLYLFIDGEEVGSESVSDDAGSEEVTFDDLDITIDEDDEVDFEIRADFDSQDGNYATTTTGLYVSNVDVDFIDQNDDDQELVEGTDGGNITLSIDSIMASPSTMSASYNGDTSTKGKYTIKFDVTAPEEDDIYIALSSAATSFEVIDATLGTATTTATTTSASLTGTTITSSHLKINKGQTKTLTLTVNLDNLGGAADKELQVGLDQISYKVGSTGAIADTYTAGLDEDYRTESLVLYSAAQN